MKGRYLTAATGTTSLAIKELKPVQPGHFAFVVVRFSSGSASRADLYSVQQYRYLIRD